MNLSDYFAMGGYAAFIWSSYGVAVLLLTALFLLSARRLQAAERALKADMAERDVSDGDT
jgi:heme exporter protein D